MKGLWLRVLIAIVLLLWAAAMWLLDTWLRAHASRWFGW